MIHRLRRLWMTTYLLERTVTLVVIAPQWRARRECKRHHVGFLLDGVARRGQCASWPRAA